ncbi:MAG: hypothetical protein COT37_01945 [Parcubacteria group bacterium CG08_land_8_20_14_0_20_43_9]|nr:MAG: hypothetical protein COT37_01945 [Parcubacteria group bacterium CG08_land_8_20_14_0_20_43_9]
MEELSRDELWAIYNTLPPTLKDALFSEDTADAIFNICKLYEIDKDSEVAKIIGKILMGLLPPEFLKDTLQEELGIKEDIATKTTMELEHFILNPVKKELDALYQEIEGRKESPSEDTKERPTEEPKKEDTYREPL